MLTIMLVEVVGEVVDMVREVMDMVGEVTDMAGRASLQMTKICGLPSVRRSEHKPSKVSRK